MTKTADPRRGSPPPNAQQPRAARRRAVSELKRQLILEAAQRVFEREGLLGANMRAIAQEAGYTAGALYNHYKSKEEIYGDLLAQSLDRLNAAVRAAGVEGPPATRLRRQALGFFDYYLQRPRELELGFYLFHGLQPLGLTPELDRRLNGRLGDALAGIEQSLAELGHPRPQRETTALFGYAVGLLLLTHTGRIRMFDQHGRELFEEHLDRLLRPLE